MIDQSVHGKRGVYYVEGYEFRYLAERQTYVYVNQTFLTLEQALKNNVITKEDLGSIHSEFKRMNAEEYKYIFEYDERYDIVLGQITIRIQPQYNDKLYTVDDFADVGCTKIEEHKVYGKVEPHHIYRGFTLYFDVDTKEETLRIGKILEAREDLLWATPIYLVPGDSVPNDSEYGSLSSDNYWAINKISLPQAWNEITGKSTIKIGIIDRGVDATHPDLQNRVNTALSTCFLENCSCKGIDTSGRHGTAVAGIIGAQANNSIGVSGVCRNV